MLLHKIRTVLTRLDFRGSYDSEDSQLAKSSDLSEEALKAILYGSLKELCRDNRYYYKSPFGRPYSKFTEEGEKVVTEFLQTWVDSLLEQEEKALDKRAKNMVIKGLKNE